VSFSAQCAPCLGHGAGPFSTTAAAVNRVATTNGIVYFVDQVLIPANLCSAFSEFNPWQCCGGCDGCRATCSSAAKQRGKSASGAGAMIVDKACEAFCQGGLSQELVADHGIPSANKSALAIRFSAPQLPTSLALAPTAAAALKAGGAGGGGGRRFY
jgi:hypothetical protein